jgi:hypothetical protein
MHLHDVRTSATGGAVRVTGVVQSQSAGWLQPYIEYRVPQHFVEDPADGLASALLLPAMRAGETLHIAPPVSPRLCVMLPRIRDIFHTWWPHLARIAVDATPAAPRTRVAPARAATFFSGGVDSFYTLLKHHGGHGDLPATMTHLIFMRGVETRLQNIRKADETERWIRDIAAATCGEAILGETNIRTVLQGPEDNLHWERHYHGSALASIALGLSGGVSFVCVPSAFSYNHLVAHGSTPLVDEMYSSDHLQVLHDGAEASRAAKVGRITEWNRDLVLEHLRVCNYNRGGAYNCGRCKKCVRTAIPLRVLGLLPQARTFEDKSTAHWERVIADDHLVLIEENLRFAEEHDADGELLAMLRRVIRRKKRMNRIREVFARPPFNRARPVALRAARYLRARAHAF